MAEAICLQNVQKIGRITGMLPDLIAAWRDRRWRSFANGLSAREVSKRIIRSQINYFLGKGKLPDFMIIGVKKGGTSSLHAHLQQHPDIEMSPNFIRYENGGLLNTKEVRFFMDQIWHKSGPRWYRSLFNDNEKLQGEATPSYIYDQEYHVRMHEVVPQVKLILTLRNPITRVYSEFNYAKCTKLYQGAIDLRENFESNIKKEISRDFKGHGFVNRGFYIDQIEHLLRFYPRNQLLILISERMIEDPQKTYGEVFDFLGVKRILLKVDPNVNKASYAKKLSGETAEILKKIYLPYNERLFEFLGYKIPEWEN